MTKDSILTQQELMKQLHYDAETGEFIRIAERKVKKTGAELTGYIRIQVNGKRHMAHRLVWLYIHGVWPLGCVDHINGNRSDNRIENLRDVSPSVNSQNYRNIRRDNTTGFMGVSINGSGFQAVIRVNGKRYGLGTYKTAEQAHRVYVEAKRKMHVGGTL